MDYAEYPVKPPAEDRSPEAPEIAVVGGNPVLGRALAQLLQGSGFRVNFDAELALDAQDDLVGRYRLIVLAPGLSPERRAGVLGKIAQFSADELAVIELVTDRGEPRGDVAPNRVPWPSPTERLRKEISAVIERTDRTET